MSERKFRCWSCGDWFIQTGGGRARSICTAAWCKNERVYWLHHGYRRTASPIDEALDFAWTNKAIARAVEADELPLEEIARAFGVSLKRVHGVAYKKEAA